MKLPMMFRKRNTSEPNYALLALIPIGVFVGAIALAGRERDPRKGFRRNEP